MRAFALLLAFCFPLSAQAQSAMKLLVPDVGWTLQGGRLFWTTTNGASWKEITPHDPSSKEIASVFFLDTSTGWVLFTVPDKSNNMSGFDLASTVDAGSNWTLSRVLVPDVSPLELAPSARIDFVDAVHGWISVDLPGSSNSRPGILLKTEDSGKTWQMAASSTYPGVAGSIRFITTAEGWLAGGPGNEYLYVTRDAAKSWRQISLKAPPQAYPATYPIYSLPVFKDRQHGFLSVTYSGPGLDSSTLVLFTSDDTGNTWKARNVVPKAGPAFTGTPVPFAIVDSTLITAQAEVPDRKHLIVRRVTPGAPLVSTDAMIAAPNSYVSELSFADTLRGWAVADDRLLSTMDGGITWADVTPRGRDVQADHLQRINPS